MSESTPYIQFFQNLTKKDVLVAVNTSPDFLPIMRQASAIIAEEGGLTAHVSVISREFGIPCIVAVQDATKLLQDGQLVTVDATTGSINILPE